VTVHLNKFFLIKPTDALNSQIYFVKKLYMFQTIPLPINRNFPLYLRYWYLSYRVLAKRNYTNNKKLTLLYICVQ